MIDILRDYVGVAKEDELNELINIGYDIVYQDINLSTIYDEIANCYENHELQQRINEIFGYYGLGLLLQVNNMYYWLMQV